MFKLTRSIHIFMSSLVLIACMAGAWHAKSAQAEAVDEILIRADYMKFDLETGDSVYEGNVSIIQGGIKLTGEKVIVRRDQKNIKEIREIEVAGSPARYLQDENTSNKVNAVSLNMNYSARESRLVMTNNARLEQADHTVESQRIVYDTVKKVIIAGKEGTEKTAGERVNITLTPKQQPAKTE